MRRSLVWIGAGLIMLAGCGGRHAVRGASVGAVPLASYALKLRAGDRTPAQGRTITTLSVNKGSSIRLDAPLVLYPDAVVQGVALIPTSPTVEFNVLLATDDSEQAVLQYYAAAWTGQPLVRPKPRASNLYRRAAPNVMSQSLLGEDQQRLHALRRGAAGPGHSDYGRAAVLASSAGQRAPPSPTGGQDEDGDLGDRAGRVDLPALPPRVGLAILFVP